MIPIVGSVPLSVPVLQAFRNDQGYPGPVPFPVQNRSNRLEQAYLLESTGETP
jgi:hypothetical protein